MAIWQAIHGTCRAVVLIALAVSLLTPAPADADLIGLVKRVKNETFGTPPGAEKERKFLRFPIVQDEHLETGADAGILVEFLDKTTLRLGPDSDLVIDTFVYDPKANEGTTVLTMTVGMLHFVSGKAQYARMQIKTPSAVIGIRGSDALIVVDEDGATTVSVFSGVFSVESATGDGGDTIGANQSVAVSATGQVSAPTAAPPGLPAAMGLPAPAVGGAASGSGGDAGDGGYDPDHGLGDDPGGDDPGDHPDDHGDHPDDGHGDHGDGHGNGNGGNGGH